MVVRGAVVERVEDNSPAAKAKLQPGDVIVGFDGQQVERGTHLQWLASTAGVGKVVIIRAIRAGQPFDVKVALGELTEPAARRRGGRAPAPLPRGGGTDD